MSDFNPNSTDAVLSRIETTLNAHVDETRLYRMSNDAAHGAVLSRVAELEGDKKKILGIVEATDAEKAAAAPRALIASRTNLLLSLPMLYAMSAANLYVG